MTSAARLSELLGNLPPLSGITCRTCARGVTAPSTTEPVTFCNTGSSRGKTTASRAPMAEVHTVIGRSMDEKVEVRKRSLSFRRSFPSEARHNSTDAAVKASYGTQLPVVKRRRIPVRVCSTRVASAIPAGH